MSNQGGYYQQGPPDHHNSDLPNSNPWADQSSQQQQQHFGQQYQPQQQQPPQQQYQQQPQYGAQGGNSAPAGYAAPPGPPPRRAGADDFNESQFVAENERGEQREAIQQFEMNRSAPENQTDRDVAALQEEFPGLDGSLIAALYGDSQSLSATREMLQELAAQAPR